VKAAAANDKPENGKAKAAKTVGQAVAKAVKKLDDEKYVIGTTDTVKRGFL
jgi:ribosomal protein L18